MFSLMVMRNRKRWRSRSRSPSLRIPRLKKGRSSRSPPDSFRIFYRTLGDDGSKSFLLKIPSDDVKFFSNLDCSCYKPHDHTRGDLNRFHRLNTDFLEYFATIPMFNGIPHGNAAAVGSTIYSMYFQGKILTLNLDYKATHSFYDQQQWEEIPTYPAYTLSDFRNPFCRPPKLLSLRGRLYFFGKKPFGEVFDPETASWSTLTEPDGIDSSVYFVKFRASLGESEGKLLFIGCDDGHWLMGNRIHIYNVESNTWQSYSGDSLVITSYCDAAMLGKAVVKEEDEKSTTLYWMNALGFICAFDWRKLRFSQGSIIGMEHDRLYNMIKNQSTEFSFFHIWGDLFCLVWSEYKRSDPPHDDHKYTNHHFTFLRVIMDSPPGSLSAYAVGCFQDTVEDFCQCCDAFLV